MRLHSTERARSSRRGVVRSASVLIAVLAAAGVTAGCGTTVQLPTGGQPLASGDDGLGLVDGNGTVAPSSDPTSGQGAGETGSGGSVLPSDGETPTDEPSSTGGPSTSAPTSGGFPATGRGYTATTVSLGWGTYGDDSTAALSALGIGGIADPGNTTAQMNAVIKDVNAHGGIAGHKVILVPHKYDTNETVTNPSQAAQTACADMTQDHKVFVMMLAQVTNETGKACFAKANTPVINNGPENPYTFRSDYKRYPSYILTGGMLADRLFDNVIERLWDRKYFENWNADAGKPGGVAKAKIGALIIDNGGGDAAIATYKKALARHGLKLDQIQRLPENVGAAITAGQAAVLKFRSAGITHVIGLTLPFAATAQQQGYHPRYYVNTAPNVVAANVNPAQLNGAMAESFAPAFDSDPAHDPGPPTAATRRCYDLMAKSGNPANNQTIKYNVSGFCDAVWFTKAAVEAAGGDFSTAGFLRGIESLGSKVESASTWTTFFGPGEHASARALRDMSFLASCKCFVFPDKVNHPAN